MSFNQSRSDKKETTYSRKSGRSGSFNQQRTSSGTYGKGGGGGGPAPSPSSSLSSNRSSKKSSNGQGVQSRVNSPVVKFSDSSNPSAPRNLQNGAHVQPQLHGVSDAPVGSSVSSPAELPASQRIAQAVPKIPTSQPTTLSSNPTGQSATSSFDGAAPKTPPKDAGDASKGFAFQFGSLSPGFMNGMQIPARTSSAPPNLDEQKRDQLRHETHKTAPPLAIPVPKPQTPKKVVSSGDQSNTGETLPVPKVKKDTQISPAPPVSQIQKPPLHSIPMSSMQIPYHQPQVSVQLTGSNPQIQSQGISAPSLQMPMHVPLSIGNAPQRQQPMFVQGLQPHPMQPQGIIHHGQSLGYTTTMGPQIPPQLSNIGIGITSQYPQQQGGKFVGPRKTPAVKITDPNTHEELRLDKRADTYGDPASLGLRSHSNLPPQSQPIPSFAHSHPVSYYPNSYNSNNMFFAPSSSLSLHSNQIPSNSQPLRFNYPVSQGPQTFINPSLNSLSGNKSGTLAHDASELANTLACEVQNSFSSTSSGTVQVTVKPATGSVREKVEDSSVPNNSSAVEMVASHKPSRPSGEAITSRPQMDPEAISSRHQRDPEAISDSYLQPPKPGSETPSEGFFSAIGNAEGMKKETLAQSNSIKDNQKKTGKTVYNRLQPEIQIVGQLNSMSSQPLHNCHHEISSDTGGLETVERKTIASSVEISTEPIRVSDSRHDGSDAYIPKLDGKEDRLMSETSGLGGIGGPDIVLNDRLDNSSLQEESKCEASLIEEQHQYRSSEGYKVDDKVMCDGSTHIKLRSVDPVKQTQEESASSFGNEVLASGTGEDGLSEPVSCHLENEQRVDNIVTSSISDAIHARKPLDNQTLTSEVSSCKSDVMGDEEVLAKKSSGSDRQDGPEPQPDVLESTSRHDQVGVENTVVGTASHAVNGSKDKHVELTRSMGATPNVKKKLKDILRKADAAGTTSDLYMAYKGPEEKKENTISSEVAESTSTDPVPTDSLQGESAVNVKDSQNKVEPDDWEHAVDISTPKLETPDVPDSDDRRLMQYEQNDNTNTAKKYSRDFLLKYAEQCVDLPEGFVTSDIPEVLISGRVSHHDKCDSLPILGRALDRSNSGARMDRRGAVMLDDDRRNRMSGPYGVGRDLRADIAYGANIGFHPGQGGNFGVPRNPRAQTPVPYVGGILTGPMQSRGLHGVMQRNGPDADRWQRGGNAQQKGLIPSPHTQMMHKAEKKYEVGKVTDEEEAKQRQLKAILNKLTPQNFGKLFEQVKAVKIDNEGTLSGVIAQIFDKALMEPTFCEMYADFCYHLARELPDFSANNEKITFKRLLLNKCQEEFERGEREQKEADKDDEEGEVKQTAEEREEKRVKARRRMLGNIRLIGELYKKKMLTERIMHECINTLLGQYQNPDEEDVEALCKLMSTIGEIIDHPKAKGYMDAYFERMKMMSNNMKLSSRVRFMLRDAIDLRKNKWQQRRKVEGPKKIEEVHRDAAQERQQQSSRLARNLTINSSARRAPMEFGARGSTVLSSPNTQMGGFRALPTQSRGFGAQDVRFEERQAYEARTLSVPLPQRTYGDDPLTLGPQGGLARGMSGRGPPAAASTTTADISSGPGDPSRRPAGLNGFSSVPERPMYNSREDLIPRYVADRFSGGASYDQLSSQERNMTFGNRDVELGISPPARAQGSGSSQNVPSDKVWPEERLRDMSMAAIKEYYSARDDKEVALCIKDLKSPSFHPSMVSLWMVDSFERKDMERDLLAKLLVKLVQSQDGTLTRLQLTKGFESVLSTLEDVVNDAPRAAEFLGRMLAKTVTENAISLGEIGQLLYEGGEEPGRLREVGLAGDVLGSTLETIKAEKGDSVLNEIRNASSFRLEDFRPSPPYRSRILETFI
ncbi:hypothetical protein K2173_011309 [Erythroxylum novogranatense]|uniref:Eukaryotic translation initiation factor 4G n=1 Tax=Erythroxylum novogranatense TaxID=1862640 RepID=A0AAV8S9N4_9ROSI|nr:hypothetical protein K2173_011309 [Erythroxylum novogranatense]